MKIFVGFGYNDRDSWIRDLVFPVVEAFGHEVVTGEDEQGEQITDETRRRIRESDGLIAFLTRRDSQGNGAYSTHRWVVEELAVAIDRGLKVVEVREEGVDEQGGMAGDRQRIPYEEAKRDRLLVDLVTTIGSWEGSVTLNLKLLPAEYVNQEIRPLLRKPGFRCTYRFHHAGRDTEPQETLVRQIGGGLFISPTAPSQRLLIEVSVEGAGKRWVSEFVPLDSVGVPLEPE